MQRAFFRRSIQTRISRGMKEMLDAGAATFARDKASCVVFGMPKEAIKMGGVQKVATLGKLAVLVLRACAS